MAIMRIVVNIKNNKNNDNTDTDNNKNTNGNDSHNHTATVAHASPEEPGLISKRQAIYHRHGVATLLGGGELSLAKL